MAEKHVVVITGANRGIGLELARHYARSGCDVIGVCREASAELKEVAAKVVEGVDVTQDAGLQAMIAALANQRVKRSELTTEAMETVVKALAG